MIPTELFPKYWISLCSDYPYNSADIGILIEILYKLKNKIVPKEDECRQTIEHAKSHNLSLIDSAYTLFTTPTSKIINLNLRTPNEQAKELIDKLGKDGALRQCFGEWNNTDTLEEEKFWNEVEEIIRSEMR